MDRPGGTVSLIRKRGRCRAGHSTALRYPARTHDAFQQIWADRSSRLGLSVEIPFTLSLDGATVTAPVLLRKFGGRNGMLLVTDYSPIKPHVNRLVELGYGYSCLSEPKSPCEEDDESFVDMLRD
jgi:hypothetical protein